MFDWIYSSITLYGESFNKNASQQHRDMLLEMLDILSEMLSWPWPSQPDARSARMDVGITFITPDPSFEPILFKKSLVPFLSTLYFANRFDSSLPQSIVNILNLFASMAPTSFSSNQNYILHLLLLCDFVHTAACAPYLQAVEKEGRPIDVGAMEGESWEKLQLLLLLKPILCTGYAGALLATPQWSDLKTCIQQLFAQLFQVAFSPLAHLQDLLAMVTQPELVDDCVYLQDRFDEALSVGYEVVSYLGESPVFAGAVGDLTFPVYESSLKTRLQVSVRLLRLYDASETPAGRDLIDKDDNEDVWAVEEEQDTIGHIGRTAPELTANLLFNTLDQLAKATVACRCEEDAYELQEQLYWVVTSIKHFVSDFDSEELPIAFANASGVPSPAILSFLDAVVGISTHLHRRME